MTKPHAALVCAFEIRAGAASGISFEALSQSPSPKAWRWIALDRRKAETRNWLKNRSGLPQIAVSALLAEETRPRCVTMEGGILVILRGLNTDPEADPADMISLRIWLEKNRIITVQGRPLMAVADMQAILDRGEGPRTPIEFFAALIERVTERMTIFIERITETLDALETDNSDKPETETREQLLSVQRTVLPLRRYLAPQRDALSQLVANGHELIDDALRVRLKETHNRIVHFVEDLTALGERTSLLHEMIAHRLTDRLNRNLYILTIIAAIFLPLTFIAGVMGANVGGIPGAESGLGFIVLCLLLGALGAFEVWLLKRLGWI